MTDRDDDLLAPEELKPTEAPSDIYAEDGSVRSDFLAMVGAAIADRDLLFLRKNVARLHDLNSATCWVHHAGAAPRARAVAGFRF